MFSLFLLEIVKKYHLKICIYLSCKEKKLSDTFWEFLYYQTLRKDQNLSVLVQSVLRCDRGGWGNAEYSSGWRAGPSPTLQYHLLTAEWEEIVMLCPRKFEAWKKIFSASCPNAPRSRAGSQNQPCQILPEAAARWQEFQMKTNTLTWFHFVTSKTQELSLVKHWTLPLTLKDSAQADLFNDTAIPEAPREYKGRFSKAVSPVPDLLLFQLHHLV